MKTKRQKIRGLLAEFAHACMSPIDYAEFIDGYVDRIEQLNGDNTDKDHLSVNEPKQPSEGEIKTEAWKRYREGFELIAHEEGFIEGAKWIKELNQKI